MISPEDLSHPIFRATTLEEFVHSWQSLLVDYKPESTNPGCRILGEISGRGLARVQCTIAQCEGYIVDVQSGRIKVRLDESFGLYNPIPEEIVFLGITKPA